MDGTARITTNQGVSLGRALIAPSVIAMALFLVLARPLSCPAKTVSSPANGFSFELPQGWVQIPDQVIKKQLEQIARDMPQAEKIHYDLGFQKEPGGKWFAYPYLLVEIKETGGFDPHELAGLNKTSPDQVKAGGPGPAFSLPPGGMVFDPAKEVVWFKSNSTLPGAQEVVGVSGFFLTKLGAIAVSCYQFKSEFAASQDEFDRILDSVVVAQSFKPSTPPGEEFSFRQTDWIKITLRVALALALLSGGFLLFRFFTRD